MPGAVLHPEEVGPADAARVLSFLNGVADADALAETLGLSEGPQVGRRVAAAILARRAAGPFGALGDVLAVTGVTLPRFTEIVTALSGARPVPAGGTLRLVPTLDAPWLGQSVGIVGQVLDARGRGLPNATVTCIASAGMLSAQVGTERQSGAALSLVTEPGGLVRFHLGPPLAPPLPAGPAAALQAELARLPREAGTPETARDPLAALAQRYRAEGSGLLRAAIDRLFDSFPAEAQSPLSPWPVMPVTLIAVAGGQGGRAEYVTVLTLRLRNWLGGWLRALREAVAGDTRLDEALKNLDRAAESGADLSQALVRATQAFAGLERGGVGSRIRDEVAGTPAIRYVERVAPRLQGSAVVNAVRTAGASRAAIGAGGFAVFEAIRAAQDVQDTIVPRRPGGAFEGRLDLLDGRLGTLEASAVDRGALEGLRDDILSRTEERLGRFQGRLDELETRRIDRAELDAVEARVAEGLDARLASRLGEMEARLGERLDATRGELSGEIDRTRRDLTAGLNRKADATAVTGLEHSVLERHAVRAAGGRGYAAEHRETEPMSRVGKAALGSAAAAAGLDALAPQGRFRRVLPVALPTGGAAQRADVSGSAVLDVTFLSREVDALAPGAPEAAALQSGPAGLVLSLPLARDLVRVRLKAPQAGDQVAAFRFDGSAVSQDPSAFGTHGPQGATLGVTDRALVLRRRNAGDHALSPDAIAGVVLRYAPANPRVLLAVEGDPAGEQALPPLTGAGGEPIFPASASHGTNLAAALDAALGRLAGAGPLPDPVALDLILEADQPCAARVDAFDITLRLERQGFTGKRVLRFAGDARETQVVELELPPAADDLAGTMVFGVSGADASGRAGAAAGPPPAHGPDGLALAPGEVVAGRIELPAAAVVAGATIVVAATEPQTAIVARLQADRDGSPGAVLASGDELTPRAVRPQAIAAVFAPTAVPAGPVWLSLWVVRGAGVVMLGGKGIVVRGGGDAFAPVPAAQGSGLAAQLRLAAPAAVPGAGVTLRLGCCDLSVNAGVADLAPALAILPAPLPPRLPLSVSAGFRTVVTLDPPVLRYGLGH